MKIASLKAGRDGQLVVVSQDLTLCVPALEVSATMQNLMDNWDFAAPRLQSIYNELNAGKVPNAVKFEPEKCHSPLPRAYQWADGSAYLNHVELVRKARGAAVPESFYSEPLMYQGGSDSFIGPRDPIVAAEAWGIDMEAEVAVICGDVAMGSDVQACANAIRLLMLVNDVSLRNMIPNELAKGFGFFQSKPASAFSPVAITPDELDGAWRDGKVCLPLRVKLNGKDFGRPDAGTGMTFNFPQLIAHVAKTRDMEAGTIIGSGTVSNKQGGLWGSSVENGGVGYCCIAEVRMFEIIANGATTTEFMKHGDTVRIEMLNGAGDSLFGAIEQSVIALEKVKSTIGEKITSIWK
ncbi:MAG: fumarylacetoacetate hydrolase family protein [Ferrovibrio sp.]|uniref:fumarylacetoacetate hydrolase family protein n=1 Tax=Ferrovibrio sp. TaxID=1917215 RepID=UPI002624639C|nr:fumarylacetoacetate hydrolase family protein [Ferrovibrio sp.]MCW0236293.1 fumarylacetoacetate hydrolase family protein [Ferrovibrio sp.]